MPNDFMGQILGHVLGGAGGLAGGGQPQMAPGVPQQGGGVLADVLGSMLGGAGAQGGLGGGSRSFMTMLLPLAMAWVQRNGGIGSVLERFRQMGYAPQANSWVGTGANQPIGPQEVSDVVGAEELSRLSQQLGVDQQQVASGLAEVLPRIVDHVTPHGHVPPNADRVLGEGRSMLEEALGALQAH